MTIAATVGFGTLSHQVASLCVAHVIPTLAVDLAFPTLCLQLSAVFDGQRMLVSPTLRGILLGSGLRILPVVPG